MRARSIANAALCCALVGACQYKPGSFSHQQKRFPGQRATVGCLDLAVDRRGDFDGKAVLEYQFGNRCDRPTVVDLQHARVVGRLRSGVEIALAPFDPDRELVPLELDGRYAGGEAIAYPANEPLAQVCVDIGSIAARDTRQPPQWLCFGQTDPDAWTAHAAPTETP